MPLSIAITPEAEGVSNKQDLFGGLDARNRGSRATVCRWAKAVSPWVSSQRRPSSRLVGSVKKKVTAVQSIFLMARLMYKLGHVGKPADALSCLCAEVCDYCTYHMYDKMRWLILACLHLMTTPRAERQQKRAGVEGDTKDDQLGLVLQ